MRKISKLGSLNGDDQELIFDLCTKHTYPEIVAILAKSRADGGLELDTNPTALCRFNQEYGWFAGNGHLVQQFADVLAVQPTPDLPDHIFTLVQRQVFLALARGRSLEDMKFQLRVYEKLLRFHLRQSREASRDPRRHPLTDLESSAGIPPEMALALEELALDDDSSPAAGFAEPDSEIPAPNSSQSSARPSVQNVTRGSARAPSTPKCPEPAPSPKPSHASPPSTPSTTPTSGSSGLYLPSVLESFPALIPTAKPAADPLMPAALSPQAQAIIARQLHKNPRNSANCAKFHLENAA